MQQPNIPLSSKVAAWLITAGQIASGLGALLLATSPESMPFGFNPYDFGLALVLASNVATVIVVALRKNVVPLVTSGVGTESQ